MRKWWLVVPCALVVLVCGSALAQQPVPVKVVDTGTVAGQVLTWVAATFGTTIGAVGTALLVRMMNNAGIIGANLLSEKLQSIIVNGLNAGAAEAAQALAGKGQVEIKNAAVASAVTYVQAHGADTLKALGFDPTSAEAVSAIKARIQTAIVDPNTPTHPALDATVAPKTAPATV